MLREQGDNIKSIVFSQYVNFLDLIEWRLQKAGYEHAASFFVFKSLFPCSFSGSGASNWTER